MWVVDSLPFFDCVVHMEEGVQQNLHTDQYSLFDTHRPPEPKLGVTGTLNREIMPTKSEGKEEEQKHISCGYSNWTFVKSAKRSRSDKRRDEKT